MNYIDNNLRRISQFYELFYNQKWAPLGAKLSWSHYREILSLKNANEIKYYIYKIMKKLISV